MQDANPGQDSANAADRASRDRLRIAVVGTPRSGNTWLRHLLALTFDLEERGFPFPEDVDWGSLPDRCALQVHGSPTPEFLADLDRNGFRPVVPARHPLDVLISLLSFATQRFDPGVPDCGVGEVELPIVGVSPRDPAFLDYAIHRGEERHLNISAEWWDRPGVVRVRYEDLVADSAKELNRLANDLGIEPMRPIAEVVAAGKMEKMRKGQTFRGWPHHFFQGRPGLWRSVLPAAEAREIARAHRGIFEALGYECDPDEALDGRDADLMWYRLQADASRRFACDERASIRELRSDLDHELAGHELTKIAYANAIDQIHRVSHILYDERVSFDLVFRDANFQRDRAERAEQAAESMRRELDAIRGELAAKARSASLLDRMVRRLTGNIRRVFPPDSAIFPRSHAPRGNALFDAPLRLRRVAPVLEPGPPKIAESRELCTVQSVEHGNE